MKFNNLLIHDCDAFLKGWWSVVMHANIYKWWLYLQLMCSLYETHEWEPSMIWIAMCLNVREKQVNSNEKRMC